MTQILSTCNNVENITFRHILLKNECTPKYVRPFFRWFSLCWLFVGRLFALHGVGCVRRLCRDELGDELFSTRTTT